MSAKKNGIVYVLANGFELLLKMYFFVLVLAIITVLGHVFEPYYPNQGVMYWGVYVVDFVIVWTAFLAMYAVFIRGYYKEKINLITQVVTAVKKLPAAILASLIYILAVLPGIIFIFIPTIISTVGDSIWSNPTSGAAWEQTYEEVRDSLLPDQQGDAVNNAFSSGDQFGEENVNMSDESSYQISQAADQTNTLRREIAPQQPYYSGEVTTPDLLFNLGKLIAASSYVLGIAWVFFISIRFALVGALIVNQNKSGLESVKASFRLTKRRWWKTLFIIILSILPTLVLSFLFGFIVTLAVSLTGGNWPIPAEKIIDNGVLIIQTMLLPLMPAVLTVYLELLEPLKGATSGEQDKVSE